MNTKQKAKVTHAATKGGEHGAKVHDGIIVVTSVVFSSVFAAARYAAAMAKAVALGAKDDKPAQRRKTK